MLGVFEIILGAMLIIEPLGRSTAFYLAATIWALMGGFILIGDAFRLHKNALHKPVLHEVEVEKENQFGDSE